jgi:hypothetical protein
MAMKRYGDKYPLNSKRTAEVKHSGSKEHFFMELSDKMNFLVNKLSSMDENISSISLKVDEQGDSISSLNKKLNKLESNSERAVNGEISGVVTIRTNQSPVSALTQEDLMMDEEWREADLDEELNRRFEPEIMENIALQTGAGFLMEIR